MNAMQLVFALIVIYVKKKRFLINPNFYYFIYVHYPCIPDRIICPFSSFYIDSKSFKKISFSVFKFELMNIKHNHPKVNPMIRFYLQNFNFIRKEQ